MINFEKAVNQAVEDGVVAGAAVIAADRSGKIIYENAFGHTSIDKDAGPMQMDSMMWIASCTKLHTAVACMQCVERGLISLDEPIGKILPEWASPEILSGFDEAGEPILKLATEPITLRHLLTHSSGIGYDGMNPVLQAYRKWQGRGVNTTNSYIKNDYLYPLLFEPGAGWEYGASLDWAGQLVERLTSTTLGAYLKANVWDAVGITSTTFRPLSNPEIRKRLVGRQYRTADGTLAPNPAGMFPVVDPGDGYGGNGLYSCAADYIRPLQSLLADDSRLLKPATAAQLFSPQLSDPKHLQATMDGPFGAFLRNSMPDGIKYNYGLGGCVAVDGIPGRASQGMLFWSGLPNSFWFIDREQGMTGFYGSQMFPPGDGPTAKLNALFHADVFGSGQL